MLQSRPGVNGLATLVFAAHEEALLARCVTAAETDAVYARRCVPWKVRIDLIYQRNWSVSSIYGSSLLQAGAHLVSCGAANAWRVGGNVDRGQSSWPDLSFSMMLLQNANILKHKIIIRWLWCSRNDINRAMNNGRAAMRDDGRP